MAAASDENQIAQTLHGIVEGLMGSAVDGAQPLMEVSLSRLDCAGERLERQLQSQ